MKYFSVLFFSFMLATFSYAALKPNVKSEESFSAVDIVVTPDGNTIIAAISDGTIRQFQASSGRQIKPSIAMPRAISAIAITDEGRKLLIGSDKMYVMELDTQEFQAIDSPRMPARAIAADRSGGFGVSASGRSVTYYNLTSGRATFTFNTPAEVFALAVNNLAQSVCAGGRDGVIRCYGLHGGELLSEYNPKIGEIRALSVSSFSMLAGGGRGAALISDKGEIQELPRHTDAVQAVNITPDGRFAVTGGDDNIPVIWDITNMRAENSPITPPMPITATAIDPYFRYIVVGGRVLGDMGGQITIQYTSKKNEIRQIYPFRDATLTVNSVGHADGIGLFGKYITYSQGGRTFAFGDVAGTVHKPERLHYAMPIPKAAQQTQTSPPAVAAPIKPQKTTPPVIALDERGFQVAEESEIRVISGTITDEAGVAWARVDGRPLTLEAGGRFSIEVTIPEGGKRVVISAADIYGNATERVVVLSHDVPKNKGGKRVAFLIGINNFRHLPALRTPEFDVRTLAEILRTRYGYEIITLIGANATRDNIISELNRLRRTLSAGDRLIVYYAGHGQIDKDTGEAFWQPFDAKPDEDTHWIPTAQIARTLAAFAAGDILVIADSCFSGVVNFRGGDTGKNFAFITSGGAEPVADGGGGRHSAFTGALIAALTAKPDGEIVPKLLFEQILTNMPKNAEQKPQYILY